MNSQTLVSTTVTSTEVTPTQISDNSTDIRADELSADGINHNQINKIVENGQISAADQANLTEDPQVQKLSQGVVSMLSGKKCKQAKERSIALQLKSSAAGELSSDIVISNGNNAEPENSMTNKVAVASKKVCVPVFTKRKQSGQQKNHDSAKAREPSVAKKAKILQSVAKQSKSSIDEQSNGEKLNVQAVDETGVVPYAGNIGSSQESNANSVCSAAEMDAQTGIGPTFMKRKRYRARSELNGAFEAEIKASKIRNIPSNLSDRTAESNQIPDNNKPTAIALNTNALEAAKERVAEKCETAEVAVDEVVSMKEQNEGNVSINKPEATAGSVPPVLASRTAREKKTSWKAPAKLSALS